MENSAATQPQSEVQLPTEPISETQQPVPQYSEVDDAPLPASSNPQLPQKSSRMPIILFLVILGLVATGGGLYFLMKPLSSENADLVASPTPSVVAEVSPSPTDVIDQEMPPATESASPTSTDSSTTAGMKTYTNTKFGYKIVYPLQGEGPDGKLMMCGNHIDEQNLVESGDQLNQVSFENFFLISSRTGYSTVQSYLQKFDFTVTLKPINMKNTDEAYSVTSDKPTSMWYLFRKGNAITRIDKNNGVVEGCFAPQNWNVSDNISF